jgi:acyl dehydratase
MSATERQAPASFADLHALIGVTLGPTAWHLLTQKGIDRFAASTEDFQWIHVDPDRARASALGHTVAHGLYTLSLGPKFVEELISFEGFAHALNYGFDRVRFPAPVPVDSRVRMTMTVTAVEESKGAARVNFEQRFERDGGTKPVCVASAICQFVERGSAAVR